MRDKSKEVSFAQTTESEESYVVKTYCSKCNAELNSSMSYTGKELAPLWDELKAAFADDTCPSRCGEKIEVVIRKV